MSCAVAVEPVKEMSGMSGWPTIALPAFRPVPNTILTTPGGTPAGTETARRLHQSLCLSGLPMLCGSCSPTSLLHQLAQHPGCHRGHLTGFCHHCIPCSDCRCNFPGQQVQWQIPGADQTSYKHNTMTHEARVERFSFRSCTLTTHQLLQGSGWCSSDSPCGPSGCSQWCGGASRMQRIGSCRQNEECPPSEQMLSFYL